MGGETEELDRLLEIFKNGNFDELDKTQLMQIASHYEQLWKDAEKKLRMRS